MKPPYQIQEGALVAGAERLDEGGILRYLDGLALRRRHRAPPRHWSLARAAGVTCLQSVTIRPARRTHLGEAVLATFSIRTSRAASRRPSVVVMQAIEDWECHDTTVCLGRSRHRLFLP
ncbi:MAG TPA: hypothetical protein VK256_09110, partial [Candidatus Eisenbacteria bacterium]|nr:hypothetical protein [Candidatus Eisenbacteria bacterium]